MTKAKLRRRADKCGLVLRASGQRNPDAPEYGLFALFDVETNFPIHAGCPTGRAACVLTLDEAEQMIDRYAAAD